MVGVLVDFFVFEHHQFAAIVASVRAGAAVVLVIFQFELRKFQVAILAWKHPAFGGVQFGRVAGKGDAVVRPCLWFSSRFLF